MPKWHNALLALIVSVCTSLVTNAQPIVGASAQQLQLGIIVTRTFANAQDVLKKLNAGMDFFVMAREYSIDPTAGEGGYLGE